MGLLYTRTYQHIWEWEVIEKTIGMILGSSQYQRWAKRKSLRAMRELNEEIEERKKITKMYLVWKKRRNHVLNERRKKERRLNERKNPEAD
jgi:hypothetical protein